MCVRTSWENGANEVNSYTAEVIRAFGEAEHVHGYDREIVRTHGALFPCRIFLLVTPPCPDPDPQAAHCSDHRRSRDQDLPSFGFDRSDLFEGRWRGLK